MTSDLRGGEVELAVNTSSALDLVLWKNHSPLITETITPCKAWPSWSVTDRRFPPCYVSLSCPQCFKSIKESSAHTELPLNLCNVIYVPKEGRKKRHELRFSLPGGEALVLAVQSKEQAERWLKVPSVSCRGC